MSAPVDVLAVMDSVPSIVEMSANDLLTMYSTPGGRPHDPNPAIADELQKISAARAAVAELIEAAKKARVVLNGAVHPSCRRPGDVIDVLDAALARIGGAA